jgi:hypothetical protein
MIISHKNRYLFIEIPLTASWAIRHELLDCYDGETILHKHASYPEFDRIASPDEKNFFTFAAIRNPLDTAVSNYFKLKTNHKGAFTDPQALELDLVDKSDIEKYRFIQEKDADFDAFFIRYFRRPYANMIDNSAPNLDYVIRYEDLQAGFSEVLRLLNLAQVRPIPVMNKTQIREDDWQTYYGPPSIESAKRNFGPFMRRWEYSFPPEWGQVEISPLDEFRYKALAQARKLYLTQIRYNSGIIGRSIRSARAVLIR